jgi:hypothetical protein
VSSRVLLRKQIANNKELKANFIFGVAKAVSYMKTCLCMKWHGIYETIKYAT